MRYVHLNSNLHTYNHYIYMENGLSPLRLSVLKRGVNYIDKLLSMADTRLCRSCYEMLRDTSFKKQDKLNTNWVSILVNNLKVIGITPDQDLLKIVKDKSVVVESLRNYYLSVNINKVLNSSYNTLYRKIVDLDKTQNYLFTQNYPYAAILIL